MKNISIWKDLNTKTYPELDKNINVDVLIIGGGITGISTLYHLNSNKLNVVLVEQRQIGMATTGNSTGKLSYLQNDLIDKIRNSLSEKQASSYIEAQKDAMEMIKKVIIKEEIDCDLETADSHLYTNNTKEINKIKKLERFLNKNKINTEKSQNDLVKSKYMIKVSATYIIHPLKFLYGLLKNNTYPIYENTSIIKIEKENNYYLCYTEKYKIKAKWVVIASHYPYFNFPFLFPIKASLEKSYLSASKKVIKPISLISYSNPFVSIRSYKDYLVYLSNSHSNNTQICDKQNFNELKKKLKYLDLKPDYLWSNIDIITSDGLPYIGKLEGQLLIGTGYNTWGLTNGFLAGQILSDIIQNKHNKYIKLFSPKRINLAKFTGNFTNTFKSISGYINGYLYKGKDNYNCSHMGCKLIFNEIEKTWDCPCHGSRFDINGKCINAPANKDINKKDLNN